MEHLIAKYLSNELSREEWLELRQWLEENGLHKTALNHLKSFSSNLNYEAHELEELVWNELQQRRGVSDRSEPKRSGMSMKTYFRIAASILIVSAISLLAYQVAFNPEPENVSPIALQFKEAPRGSKVTTRLPDGSRVQLNAESRISFPDQFTGESRVVELVGEAFFDVEHNPEKPFYVKMNGDEVRVLGTSFNIRSYPEDSAVYISVATGRVSYSIPSGEQVTLEPDQMATYLPGSGSLIKSKVDRLQAFGWKDKILCFRSTAFDDVIFELERWYGVEIEVTGDFEELGPFTGVFRNESLEQVLKGLSYIYPFQFNLKDNNVTVNKI